MTTSKHPNKKQNKNTTVDTTVDTTPVVVNDTQVQDEVSNVLNQVADTLTDTQEVVTTITAQLTKADIARTIFNEERAKPEGLVRKIILDRFQKEANLTKKGASTYFQNLKRKANMIKPVYDQ